MKQRVTSWPRLGTGKGGKDKKGTVVLVVVYAMKTCREIRGIAPFMVNFLKPSSG